MTHPLDPNRPADAGDLRAIASDIADDRSFVFGDVTASQLRALADHLEATGQDAETILGIAEEVAEHPEHEHELVITIVKWPTDGFCAVGLEAGMALLGALANRESDSSKEFFTFMAGSETPADDRT